MADEIAHLRKAKHNESFLALVQRNDSMIKPTYADWIVTVAFYVAVQYVDSKLAKIAHPAHKHPANHSQRNTAVAIYFPKTKRKVYFYLKSKSEYGRYFPDSERRISPHAVQRCVGLALTMFK